MRVVFDPTYPTIDYNWFPENEREQFYGNVTKELPHDMPESLGREMIITFYVDANLAGNKLTRQSRTGFIVFCNQAPIYWYSKKQGCIETRTFGAKFMAMKTCCK